MGRRDKIIDETLDRYPNVGNRTLARLLVEQYPELYTIESARSAIRYRNGAHGKASRKKVQVDNRREHCTLGLPPGTHQVKPPVKFTRPGDWIVTGDWHIEYHEECAIDAMVKYAVDNKIPNLLLNGDIVDFYGVSDHITDPRFASPSNELDILRKVLKQIKKYFKGELVYKIGNHEDRYERYLYQRARALVGIEEFQLDKVLKLDELGYRYVTSKQHVILGSLPIFHGHELPKGMGSPVSPARVLYNRIKTSGAVSHHHVYSQHVETEPLSKKTHITYSIPCMCKMVKDYSPINNWNQGFARARINSRAATDFVVLLYDRGKIVSHI